MLLPFFFQAMDSQAVKEFPFALKVGTERGYQQTFTKSARTREKVILARGHQLMDKLGFIHIYVVVFAETLKELYSKRVFHRSKNKFRGKIT